MPILYHKRTALQHGGFSVLSDVKALWHAGCDDQLRDPLALHSTVLLNRARHAESESMDATWCSQIPHALMHACVADVEALQALQVGQASQSAGRDCRLPQMQPAEVGHGCYAEDAPVISVRLRQIKVPQAGHVPEQVQVRQLLAACNGNCAIRWLAEGNAIT